ncbi:MAG: RecX family transcriptional regulator [Deltaproteobacteria bacterium]|nr:RecX family transcriptional regulator [Deltaproteobacteria bacterium]
MVKKERTALEAAMDILTLRAHGREELSRKLAQRGFPEDEIEGALDRALELGLMEPEPDLARRYALELAKKKGATPLSVRAKLEQRGLSGADAEAAVDAAFAEWDPLAAAKAWVAGETDPRRAARRLQQKGFSADVIARVMRALGARE